MTFSQLVLPFIICGVLDVKGPRFATAPVKSEILIKYAPGKRKNPQNYKICWKNREGQEFRF